MDTYLKFVQAHTKLVLGVIALLVVLHGVNRYMDNTSASAVKKEVQTSQTLQTTADNNQNLADQIQDQKKQYDKLAGQTASNTSAVQNQISQLQSQVQKQQAADQTSTLPLLALQWQNDLGGATDISTVGDTVQVGEQSARLTVQKLDEAAFDKQAFTAEEKVAIDKDTQLASLASLNTSLTSQVNGLNDQIKAQQNDCKAQINVAKKTGFKSKMKTFFIGVASGVVIAVRGGL